MTKVGRNDPCPCGSGKKYKKCCLGKEVPSTPAPRIVTSDREDMVFLEAVYDCNDSSAAIRRLGAADDFDQNSDDPVASFDWLERGCSAKPSAHKPRMPGLLATAAGSRVLGSVTIKHNRLILKTHGRNRFENGKERLASLLSGLIRHRLDSVQSLESAIHTADTAGHDFQAKTLGPPPVIPLGDKRFAPLAAGETLQEAVESRGFESLEEINLFADRVMQDYNNQPQADMAGLSPVQVRRLLDADWEDENGSLGLNASLDATDVRDTPMLHNARVLIELCESLGGAKVTSAGNLNRNFVAELIPRLNLMEDRTLRYLREERSIINEQDVWFLHLTRVISGLAGLTRKYKGRFVPTKRGLQLMEEGRLPELYRHLFLTTFRKFNLGYGGRVGHPDIQSTMAYSLHVLGKLPCETWQDAPEERLADILLPAVRDQLLESFDPERAQIILKASVNNWVLAPLSWFGLVETQAGKLFSIKAFRTTPLYAKFISFEY